NQVVDGRLVLPGPVLAVGGDRAGDEPRVDGLEPRPGNEPLQRRARREILHEHVGARHEPEELGRRAALLRYRARAVTEAAQGRVEIESHTLLAAVPHHEAAVTQVRRAGSDE